MRGLLLAVALATLALLSAGSRARGDTDVDEAKLAQFGSSGLLRWENIEGPPYWVGGTPLDFESARQLHFARIAPGAQILVHVPAGCVLRVAPLTTPLAPDDVQLWVSNGSGLYRATLSGIVSSDGSWLLTPGEWESSLVRVTRAAERSGCIDVALFLSRRLVPEEAFSYPCEWVGCEPAVTLTRDATVLGQYQYLKAGQRARIRVAAPARLRIESMLEIAPLEAESYQTYQLKIQGNNTPPRVQQIHTRYDRRHVHSVDGTVHLLGEHEVDYLDVPVGAEQLELTSTANTLLRITVAPCRTAYPAGWDASADAPLVGSIWNLKANDVLSQFSAADYPASRRWRIAQRLARDNRYRDGGIQAWNLLRQLAAENPAHVDLNRWAIKAKLTYTTYRTLLPVEVNDTMTFHDAWFVTRPLSSPEVPTSSPVLATSLVDDALEALPGGTFVEVPAAGEISCALPPDVLDTQIRVAIQRHQCAGMSPCAFRVQCDNSAPVHLRLYDDEALPPALLQTSTSECGLAALNRQFGPFDAGTLGGPFASRRHAAPWIDAATAELNVARGTRSVRLMNDSSRPIRVCLAYRTSREVALTESEFLACLTRQPDFAGTFLAILSNTSSAVVGDADALAELRNHCEPLLRKLERHHRAFASGVSPPTPGSSAGLLASSTGEDVNDHYQNARRLMEQRQWVEAVALWTIVAENSTGDVRREALLQRIDALTALGENVLAETELRGRILYDPDVVVRKSAALRLAQTYREMGDTEAIQRLASAALLTNPSPEAVAAFAAAAAENDDWPAALIATLATPPDQRSAELLLQAAYQQGWWQIFHRTLHQLSDTSLRNYWAALGSIRQGDYAVACQLLTQAGERGEQLKAHIVRGHQIVQRLRAIDLDERLQGLREWEEWTAIHPGPHTWRRDEILVSACRGIDYVVSDSGDDGYRAYRATTKQPVEICVNGPVQLRIEARPLHPAGNQSTLDDWLFVRGSGRQLVWPITGNRPADTLVLQSDPAHVPGRLVQTQLHLGPGQHRLHVWAESSDLLLRVAARRPQYSLGMLPPITPATVAAIVDGRWGQMLLSEVNGPAAERRPRTARQIAAGILPSDIVDLPLVLPTTQEPLVASPRVSPIVTAWQRATLGLRDGTLSADEARRILAQPTSVSIFNRGEMIELVARANLPPSAVPSLSDPQLAIDWQWMSVFHGQLVEALRVDPGSDRQARHTHVALLLRLAEQQPSERARCAVRLAELAIRHPTDRFVAKQFERLNEPGEWILINEVLSSGGLYSLPDTGPQPTMLAARVRHALAQVADRPGDSPGYLITGYRKLSLEAVEPHPVVLELELSQPQISYLPAPQLQVEIKINDQPARTIAMPSSGMMHRVRIPLAAGKHRVETRIVNPFAGHYVFLNIHEFDSAGRLIPWRPSPGNSSTERLYHVATQTTPVELRLRGPAWIRVERVVDGRREIDETTVAQGDQQVALSAPEDARYALYRIWEYRFGEAPAEPPVFAVKAQPMAPTTHWLSPTVVTTTQGTGYGSALSDGSPSASPARHVEPLAQPELAGLAPADAVASSVDIGDAFPLGGFEDGTWGWSAGAAHRRALEEGRQFTGKDRFAQLALSYELYRPEADAYTKTVGLFRLRDSSGPTFGLTHESWQPLPHLIHQFLPDTACEQGESVWFDSLKLNNLWTAYFQHPSDAIPPYDRQTEVSLGTRNRVYWRHDLTDHSYHFPSITLFSRWLSMDDTLYQPDRVDQDIFTPFKYDQRVGFYLTDSWIHEPVESARVWVRPGVYTNEDLNPFRPDHISLQAGLSSLWYQTDWQLAYRVARFFDDEDRSQANTQHLLYFDAAIDHWQHAGSRYELSVSVRHELADGDTSAFLTLTRFVSRGRGYRDQHPSEVGFRSLRERAAYPTWQFFEPIGL